MPVDVKGEVMTYEEKRRDGYLYVFLIGKVREKGILWFSYKDISKELWMLALQVTEMLCNYCLKAISNPTISAACFTHTHINICTWREKASISVLETDGR